MTAIKRFWVSLGEPSTWAALGVIISGASTVAAPYAYAVIGCGIAGWVLKEAAG